MIDQVHMIPTAHIFEHPGKKGGHGGGAEACCDAVHVLQKKNDVFPYFSAAARIYLSTAVQLYTC